MTLGEVEGPEDTDHLRPAWLVRVAILVPCALLVGGAFAAWLASPHGSGLDLAVIVSLVCLYVIVRWMFFMGVRRDGESMVVTGALWSRRIRLAQIERVTDFQVFVWWRTRSGLRMFTPLAGFSAREGSVEAVARRNSWAIAQIRQWVGQERLSQGPTGLEL